MYGSAVAKSCRINFYFHDYMRITADLINRQRLGPRRSRATVRMDGDDRVK